MSILIVGHTPDGRRITVDQGPSVGRVSGYGGSLVAHHVLTVTKPPAAKRLPRAPLNRVRSFCGFLMPRGSVCARGRHKDVHHRAAVSDVLA